MIQVGTGGRGNGWCRQDLPPIIEEDLVEPVAAVDVNPMALVNAREGLGLRADQCYTDIHKAFDENRADFCTVVVPPASHEEVVDLALAHDMHVLSEKPIADSLTASVRIADKVKRSGKKMGVTMNHRFDDDKTTLRHELRSGQYGTLDYLVCRFTHDARRFGDWAAGTPFRHEIPDPLMVEGSVHHLDFLADMSGARCETLYAQTWNPRWGEYRGDSQALIVMNQENGVKVLYEGAKSNGVGLNSWRQEYIRAECEKATLVLSHRRLERFLHDPSQKQDNRLHGEGEEVPLIQRPAWRHDWLIRQFVSWLDGGDPMATNLEDNLQSVAMIFGAIESSQTGQPVRVQDLLTKTRRAVEAA
jgi:predicted dehydrogenase